MESSSVIFYWLLAAILVICLFYGLNHLVMSLQGLPLNLDLTPAQ